MVKFGKKEAAALALGTLTAIEGGKIIWEEGLSELNKPQAVRDYEKGKNPNRSAGLNVTDVKLENGQWVLDGDLTITEEHDHISVPIETDDN
jgi:hypothetical protein